MIADSRQIGWRPRLVAYFVVTWLLLGACGSSPTPEPTSPLPLASTGSTFPTASDPSASARPSASDAPAPPTPLAPQVPLPMTGFAGYEQVQMIGGEFAATAFTDLSCDALTGWLQAGDWRLDADTLTPLPVETPAAGAVVPPRTRWLALSRPGDGVVAKLVSKDAESGCSASVRRLSRQPLAGEGHFTASTTASAYQVICSPDSQSVQAAMFFFGDDGTRAFITAEIPLVLGEQQLLDGSVRMGKKDFTLAALTEALSQSLDGAVLYERLENYEAAEGTTGTATVTSIDPLVATVEFTGLVSGDGVSQSVTAGFRCDLPGRKLTNAAIPPEVTPPPTVPPSGTMVVTVGSGADGISESLAGPEISCSFGIMGEDTWFLQHDDSDGVTVFVFIPPEDSATLTFYDWRTSIPTRVEIDPARTGGHLTATVDDRGSEVGFTAEGVTGDGRDVHVSATCRAIERL